MTEEYKGEWCQVSDADGRSSVQVHARRFQNFTGRRQSFTLPNWLPARPDPAPGMAGKLISPVAREYVFLGPNEVPPPRPLHSNPALQIVFVPYGTSELIPEDQAQAVRRVKDGVVESGLAPQLTELAPGGERRTVAQHPALTAVPRPPTVENDQGRIERLRHRALGGVS